MRRGGVEADGDVGVVRDVAFVARRRDEADKRNVIIQRTVKGALYVEKLGDMVVRKAGELTLRDVAQ